ncbi:MAG: type II toxin-antitoxin system RelB/DinJ family antitoxin [Legionellales bacterium]|nr:type II toxin-antitoxin system RelB/DinJ family antitoxin [Legionellales bacterium]
MRKAVVRGMISSETKQQAEIILSALGLSTSDAINLMLKQVILQKRLPFDIALPNIPNTETALVLEKSERGEEVIKTKGIDDFLKQLDL